MEYYRKNYSLIHSKNKIYQVHKNGLKKNHYFCPRKIYICKTLEISQLLPM